MNFRQFFFNLLNTIFGKHDFLPELKVALIKELVYMTKTAIMFGQNFVFLAIVYRVKACMNLENYVACNFHCGANVDKASALSHYLLQ